MTFEGVLRFVTKPQRARPGSLTTARQHERPADLLRHTANAEKSRRNRVYIPRLVHRAKDYEQRNEIQETKTNNRYELWADSEKIPARGGYAGGNQEVRFSSIQRARSQAPGAGLVSGLGQPECPKIRIVAFTGESCERFTQKNSPNSTRHGTRDRLILNSLRCNRNSGHYAIFQTRTACRLRIPGTE